MLQEELGIGINNFGGTKDRGRDAYFEGNARYPPNEEKWSGVWIFQAKFRDFIRTGENKARKSLISSLKKELEKILEKYEDKCNNYIYITNVELTVNDNEKMKEIAEDFSIENFRIIHFPEINSFFARNINIKWQFPRLIGFADLNKIINKSIKERSKAFLEAIQPYLEVFVPTNIYFKAIDVVKEFNFVILEGPPKMGKTMIADAICLSKVPFGFTIYDINKPEEFFKVYNKNEKQLFLCDDVFGAISVNEFKSEDWVRDLSKILIRLGQDHQLIWSSRTSLFREVLLKTKLDENSEKIEPRKVIVEVIKLSRIEKAQILYNHLKLSHISAQYNKNLINCIISLKKNIIDHKNFSPEIIRQLCTIELKNIAKINNCKKIESRIIDFLNTPDESWKKAFYSLKDEDKLFLITLFSMGSPSSIKQLKIKFNKILKFSHRNSINQFELSSQRLFGTFIKKIIYGSKERISFYHPSIMDIIKILSTDDNHIEELLLKLGGSFLFKDLYLKHNLNSPQRKSLIDSIINEEAIQELVRLLSIIKNMKSDEISIEEMEYLLKYLCSSNFYIKFNNQISFFSNIFSLINKYNNLDIKVQWIDQFINKLFNNLDQFSIKTLLDLIEALRVSYYDKLNYYINENSSINETLDNFLKIESEHLSEEYDPEEAESFNELLEELNQVLIDTDIEFDYFLEEMTDEEKAEFYADVYFDEDVDRYPSSMADDVSEDSIIDFIFDDFFE